MDDFTRIRTFIKVVDAGSFSAAARDVSSTSSVARQVKSLEDELGVRLLNRNSRNLSLTDAGRRFYERVTSIAEELNNAKSEAKSLHDEVKGLLRVSLRITAGMAVILPALPKLLAQYPELMLDVTLTNDRRDLIANNIDVAVWLGDMPNAEIVARRLAPNRRVVCGSPAYLAKHGTPQVPQDLGNHDCLLFAAPSYGNRWSFTLGDKVDEVQVRGSVCSDNGLVLLSCGLADLGLIIVQEWMVRNDLAEGRMVQVLSKYNVSPRPGDVALYALFPSSRALSRKVRVFVDFLIEAFADQSGPR